MTFRPILFSTDMVRSILDGRKTQTLRVKFTCDVGDVLWVRETFCLTNHGNPVYKADCRDKSGDLWSSIKADPKGVKWKPSIFMPREAARLFLRVESVRVERLQDITDEDAKSEGMNCKGGVYRELFVALWDSLNAKRGYGWETNPLVKVIEFRRVEL